VIRELLAPLGMILLTALAIALAVSFGLEPRLGAEVVLAVTVASVLTALLRQVPPPRRRPSPVIPTAPTDRLDRTRATVEAAVESDWGVQTQLRPVVQDIVSARLATVHGLSLADEPDRARALLPDEVADLLAGDSRSRPRTGGMAPDDLAVLLDRLEEL
jgi:hypothetical protein